MTYEVDFKKLKQKVLIEDVINYYDIPVRESGDQLVADCPFCESNTGSFKISLEKNAFMCHSCKEKGNILDFVAKKEGLNIKDAAVFIANNIRKPDALDSKIEQSETPSPIKNFRQVARIVITVEVMES